MAYLEELDSTISTFEDLPEKIRKSHTSLSAQLLMNSQLDKYRDRCNEVDIIQRMHSCTTGGPFHLNSLAFIDHKSNFRIDALNLFFDAAGIPGISTSIKQEPAFEEYKAKRFSDQGIDRLPDKVVFEDLDELAWRRNVVAHGWPDSTLSIELMKERAAFIQALGECIYEVLRQSLLPHVVKHLGRALASPLAVYDHSVVCFRLETGTISTGSRIIARAPTGRHFEGRVISLELEHISQEKVAAPPPVDVGCRVGFKAKMNQDYFLIEER